MSGTDLKKPQNKEQLIELLRQAIRKELEIKESIKKRTMNPTISGTAKVMKIHRDTLYQWLKEFNVDFENIGNEKSTFIGVKENIMDFVFLIGEALIGTGAEVAHVDLMIGDKRGPVGVAFANNLANMSVGHTPILAVIRPNLPPKPHTLLVPKVTVKNREQVEKILDQPKLQWQRLWQMH